MSTVATMAALIALSLCILFWGAIDHLFGRITKLEAKVHTLEFPCE